MTTLSDCKVGDLVRIDRAEGTIISSNPDCKYGVAVGFADETKSAGYGIKTDLNIHSKQAMKYAKIANFTKITTCEIIKQTEVKLKMLPSKCFTSNLLKKGATIGIFIDGDGNTCSNRRSSGANGKVINATYFGSVYDSYTCTYRYMVGWRHHEGLPVDAKTATKTDRTKYSLPNDIVHFMTLDTYNHYQPFRTPEQEAAAIKKASEPKPLTLSKCAYGDKVIVYTDSGQDIILSKQKETSKEINATVYGRNFGRYSKRVALGWGENETSPRQALKASKSDRTEYSLPADVYWFVPVSNNTQCKPQHAEPTTSTNTAQQTPSPATQQTPPPATQQGASPQISTQPKSQLCNFNPGDRVRIFVAKSGSVRNSGMMCLKQKYGNSSIEATIVASDPSVLGVVLGWRNGEETTVSAINIDDAKYTSSSYNLSLKSCGILGITRMAVYNELCECELIEEAKPAQQEIAGGLRSLGDAEVGDHVRVFVDRNVYDNTMWKVVENQTPNTADAEVVARSITTGIVSLRWLDPKPAHCPPVYDSNIVPNTYSKYTATPCYILPKKPQYTAFSDLNIGDVVECFLYESNPSAISTHPTNLRQRTTVVAKNGTHIWFGWKNESETKTVSHTDNFTRFNKPSTAKLDVIAGIHDFCTYATSIFPEGKCVVIQRASSSTVVEQYKPKSTFKTLNDAKPGDKVQLFMNKEILYNENMRSAHWSIANEPTIHTTDTYQVIARDDKGVLLLMAEEISKPSVLHFYASNDIPDDRISNMDFSKAYTSFVANDVKCVILPEEAKEPQSENTQSEDQQEVKAEEVKEENVAGKILTTALLAMGTGIGAFLATASQNKIDGVRVSVPEVNATELMEEAAKCSN
jgi:hypothetical protein